MSVKVLVLSVANIHLIHRRGSEVAMKVLCTIMLDIGSQIYSGLQSRNTAVVKTGAVV